MIKILRRGLLVLIQVITSPIWFIILIGSILITPILMFIGWLLIGNKNAFLRKDYVEYVVIAYDTFLSKIDPD